MNKNSLQPDSEKKQNRFIFCCIGLILYTMPCMSCLMIPILTEGLTTPMIAALATVFAGVAAGFIGMNRFKAKKGRAIVSPELILLVLLVIWSDVVENR